MTTVFLIRHGEIDNPDKIFYGRSIDLELNGKGKEQILSLAEKINDLGYKIDKIYSSPLIRAKQSSEIISKILGLKGKFLIENNLIDVDIPVLVGKPLLERAVIHKKGIDEYSEEYVKLGNESRSHIVDRVKKIFGEIVTENKGKVVAIVSHGDPLQFLLYVLSHPGEKIPSNVLESQNYPSKGSAVKLVIDDKNMRILEREKI